MGLPFLSGAHKCNQQPISDLYDSKFLPHFKVAIFRDGCYDDVGIGAKRKDENLGYLQ